MRPVSIVWFERFYLASLVLGLLSTMINWSTISAAALATPGAPGLVTSPIFMIVIMAISIGFSLLFWYLIARRGSKVAKWILVIFVVVGLLSLPGVLRNPLYGTSMVAMALINYLLQLAAVVCTFRSDTHDWFNGTKPVDPNAFS